MTEILHLNPKLLHFNPWNSNEVSEENMEKLKKSILELGFNSSVIVRQVEIAHGEYIFQVLGGQHRVKAAIELGFEEIPLINVGIIPDSKAKTITLADNSRYGADNSFKLASILEELRVTTENITSILPLQDKDLQVMMKAVKIDLDTLEIPEEMPPPVLEERAERPAKTHEILSFKLPMRDAEMIRRLIEKTIKEQELDDGCSEDKILAGNALSFICLGKAI